MANTDTCYAYAVQDGSGAPVDPSMISGQKSAVELSNELLQPYQQTGAFKNLYLPIGFGRLVESTIRQKSTRLLAR